jgi:hypothetical protein
VFAHDRTKATWEWPGKLQIDGFADGDLLKQMDWQTSPVRAFAIDDAIDQWLPEFCTMNEGHAQHAEPLICAVRHRSQAKVSGSRNGFR